MRWNGIGAENGKLVDFPSFISSNPPGTVQEVDLTYLNQGQSFSYEGRMKEVFEARPVEFHAALAFLRHGLGTKKYSYSQVVNQILGDKIDFPSVQSFGVNEE